MCDSILLGAALDDEALYTELTAVKGIGRLLSMFCAYFRTCLLPLLSPPRSTLLAWEKEKVIRALREVERGHVCNVPRGAAGYFASW